MIGRFLCWLGYHKHPKEFAPAYWECARPGCRAWKRQRWY